MNYRSNYLRSTFTSAVGYIVWLILIISSISSWVFVKCSRVLRHSLHEEMRLDELIPNLPSISAKPFSGRSYERSNVQTWQTFTANPQEPLVQHLAVSTVDHKLVPASSTWSGSKTPTPVKAAVSTSKVTDDALQTQKNVKLPMQKHHAEASSGDKTPEDKMTNLEELPKKVLEQSSGSRDWEEGKKEKKKIEPHIMELNEKEKLIAEGAQRNKDDYPTMGDIFSDWDTKDEALAKKRTERTEESRSDDRSKRDIRSSEEKSALETSMRSEKKTAKKHEENLMMSEKRSAKEYEETQEASKRGASHLEEVRRRPTLSKRRSKEGISKLEVEDIRKIAAALFGKKSEDEEEMPVVPEEDGKFKEKEEKGRADAREQAKKEIGGGAKPDTPKKEASVLRDIPDSVIRDFGIVEKRQKKPKRIPVPSKVIEPAGKKSAEKYKNEVAKPSPPFPVSRLSYQKTPDDTKPASSPPKPGQRKSTVKLIKRRKPKEKASKGSETGERKFKKVVRNVGKKPKKKQKAQVHS